MNTIVRKNHKFLSTSAVSDKYRSPLRYPGGKQKAISQIMARFPKACINEYREPLAGGASVFFAALNEQMARSYWINDLFEDLICFWKTVQSPKQCRRLVNELKDIRASFGHETNYERYCKLAKKYFEELRNNKADKSYDKALAFFYFNRVSFSGSTLAGGFSKAASLSRFTLSAIARLEKMPEALRNIDITNLDYEQMIQKPGSNVFMFIDPPYYTSKRLYGIKGKLHEFDHERLAHALQKTRHMFLITYDNCPEIRKLYGFAKISTWQLQYGMNNCNHEKTSHLGAELFISNYN